MIHLLIGSIALCVFLFFQAQGIPAGDSGDLVTAAATFGVPHPPGYPLYTFLGWMASHIPLFTVSWRVGLLSSLPHALVIVLVYSIVFHLTRKVAAGIFSVLFLLGNYVFFMYSVTPEVFALLDLFIVVLLWLAMRWQETKRLDTLYLFLFVMGVSLTHHHVILFLFPALVYFLWQKNIPARFSYPKAIGVFIAGLLPYSYVLAAARGNSMVLWDRATSLANVIRLITRADYGTFQSGAYIGAIPIQRLLGVQAYMQNIYADFSWFGILLVVLGFGSLWRTKRKTFWLFFLSALSVGPVFLFYASFPLMNRFSLGTYERFLLPSYVLLSIVVGVGFYYLIEGIANAVRNFRLKVFVTGGVATILFLSVATLSYVTVWKFVGYATDRTAEHLAMDVLGLLPSGAMLVLDRDTVLFTAQYMRYVQRFRKDLVVLHNSRLDDAQYREVMRKQFPTLFIPTSSVKFFEDFMKTNTDTNRVFVLSPFAMGPDWYWVPYGFVYELLPKSKLPSVEVMKADNMRIWQMAHDPGSGILARYNHLMLSDVRDVYTTARVEFGKTLLKAGDIDEAKNQFIAAIGYGGESQMSEAYMYLGLSESFLKHCSEAISALEKSRQFSLSVNHTILLYEAQTYEDCFGDKKKAQELYDRYARSQEDGKTPLLKL